jgi:Asp-tRNA(Asn)/Glu-tRNA(Gln) amidotransferase A subunit family amidase
MVAVEYQELLGYDAFTLAQMVRSGQVSATETVRASLLRIEEANPAVNALTEVLGEEALASAKEIDASISRGSDVGALCGVPVIVKDSIWMKGSTATLGSRSLADFVAPEDAVAVERLRAAGAIVVARSTMPEFGVPGFTRSELFGVTRNPWNLERTPGGSSGGSSAALAACMVPLALGTDGGGSIRKPAAYVGATGLKPTFGRIPRGPGGTLNRTMTVVGPMARSVRDLALSLSVLAGWDPRDPLCLPDDPRDYLADMASALAPRPRVAWSVDLGVIDVDPVIRDGVVRALEMTERLGWRLTQTHPPAEGLAEVARGILASESDGPPEGSRGLLEPATLRSLESVLSLSAVDAYRAQLARDRLNRAWEEFFVEHDLLVLPSVAAQACSADPRPEEEAALFGLDAFLLGVAANVTGQPSVAVPIGLSPDGMPLGVQVMGPRGSDARCLAAAAAIERAVDFRRPGVLELPTTTPPGD